MRFLPSEDQVVVDRALALGLNGAVPAPAYLSPQLCTALSFLLAVPTLGFSLVLIPILWVAQHGRTKHRIMGLRKQLEKDNYRIGLSDPGPLAGSTYPVID